jgi:hypothetical protein
MPDRRIGSIVNRIAERLVMTLRIQPLPDPNAKSALCARLTAELPMWFGRPESNAAYARGMASDLAP